MIDDEMFNIGFEGEKKLNRTWMNLDIYIYRRYDIVHVPQPQSMVVISTSRGISK